MPTGIRKLDKLLKAMNPVLNPQIFVFISVSNKADIQQIENFQGCYKESEGMTFILEKTIADQQGLIYSGTWRAITISIHSDLEAVGFTAKIAKALAQAAIPCNVIAAYYHDHIYVPSGQADKAMKVLADLQKEYSGLNPRVSSGQLFL